MRKYRRLILAILIAPLAAPLVACVTLFIIFYSQGAHIWSLSEIIDGFAGVFFWGAVVSYTFAIFLGLPMYWLFNKIKLINYCTLSVGGTLIAVLPLVIMNIAKGIIGLRENLPIYLGLAACGFAVANVFYFITKRRPPNNRLDGRPGLRVV